MPRVTKHQKVIELVKRMGGVEVESRSRKYKTFSRKINTLSKGETDQYLFVGRAGSLRIGLKNTSSNSRSITHNIPRLMIQYPEGG